MLATCGSRPPRTRGWTSRVSVVRRRSGATRTLSNPSGTRRGNAETFSCWRCMGSRAWHPLASSWVPLPTPGQVKYTRVSVPMIRSGNLQQFLFVDVPRFSSSTECGPSCCAARRVCSSWVRILTRRLLCKETGAVVAVAWMLTSLRTCSDKFRQFSGVTVEVPVLQVQRWRARFLVERVLFGRNAWFDSGYMFCVSLGAFGRTFLA